MTRRTHSEMAAELAKMLWSKETWLRTFSGGKNKRPDHEIETRRHERDVLAQAKDDYQSAARRGEAA